jgi:hypothetical protein
MCGHDGERLKGNVRDEGIGWVPAQCPRILRAHAEELPDIEQYCRGSFNIDLTYPLVWRPRNEGFFYARSRDRGLWLAKSLSAAEAFAIGSDFLACGNFIHPQIRVVCLNGRPIEGRLYFAGVGEEIWQRRTLPWPLSRRHTGIEIISKHHLRSALGFDSNANGAVEVELEIDFE